MSPLAHRLSRSLRRLLPLFSLLLVIVVIAWLNPRAVSYFGFDLMLSLALPIALATVAQMFVIASGDLDLSIGSFVSFAACVGATWLNESPLVGWAVLAAGVAAYAGVGALIHLRNLPSIVVTLGMSFVWQGLALLVLVTPGGEAPGWLRNLFTLKPPLLPLSVVGAIIVAVACHFFVMRSGYGVILRGSGGNATAVARSGWSLLKVKVTLYALAGLLGVLSSLALIGVTTSADPNIGASYTLLSIAGVILGGGAFTGGIVSPVGAVIGALTLTLASSPLLTFLRIPPDWQIGANGALLIAVLAARALVGRQETAK
jgi:ribose transport system permease protein